MPKRSGGGQSGFKNPPRNYRSVPLNRYPTPASEKSHRAWDREGLTGALSLRIETLTPVHVGTGGFALVANTFGSQEFGPKILAKDIQRSNGRPIIPGSSLKGMCRYALEAITESGKPRVDRKKPDRAASIFGSFGKHGRQGFVSFDDATSRRNVRVKPIWVSGAYPPNKDVGRRFYGPQPQGANQPPRCPALAIPAGADLETTLHVENLKDFELGWILLALGIQPRFDPKIGGAKYDTFGWVRVHVESWSPRCWPDKPKPIRGEVLKTTVDQWSQHGLDKLESNAQRILQRIQQHMQAASDGAKS